MRKIFILILFSFLTFSLPVSAYAGEQVNELTSKGYTEDGIYYEIYDVIFFPRNLDNSVYMTRNIIYNGIVNPEAQIAWQETIDGVTYSGTLYLTTFSYNPSTNQTTATYEGTLTTS